MEKLEFMVNFTKQNAFTAATLQFNALRREAMRILNYLDTLKNVKDNENYIDNFYVITFMPFKKAVDEINFNF